MRVLEARAVKAGTRWRVELPGIGLAVETCSLETLDGDAAAAAARALDVPAGDVRVQVRWYLEEADVLLRHERASAHVRSRREAEERAQTAAARARALREQREVLRLGRNADERSLDVAGEALQLARQRAARARRRAGDAAVRQTRVRGEARFSSETAG